MTALVPLACSHQPNSATSSAHNAKPPSEPPSKPVIETVDRVFIASSIRLEELNHTVHDIKTRHADGAITILVRYPLRQPFASSKELAYDQGETVKDYLQEQGISLPIRVITSPADQQDTTIWISYAADQNKGSGVVMHDIPALPAAPDAPVTPATSSATPKTNDTM